MVPVRARRRVDDRASTLSAGQAAAEGPDNDLISSVPGERAGPPYPDGFHKSDRLICGVQSEEWMAPFARHVMVHRGGEVRSIEGLLAT